MKINTLESTRLILNPIDISYCNENYLYWLNDPDVYKYMESGGQYTKDSLLNYVTTAIKNDILFWAICLKSNNVHIGNIKIDPISYKHKRAELGILIGDKREWSKGYAKEAANVVIEYCFTNLDLIKITLGVVDSNVNAINLYKNLGFVIEGNYKKHVEYNNVLYNILRMSLFKNNL
jgi:ribosomal-protein-alanine N-acetyltransferase